MKREYEKPAVSFVLFDEKDLFVTSSASECTCFDEYDAVCDGFCLDF